MFKLELEKVEEPEIKLPTSVGSLKKQESSRKTSIPASLTMLKPLTMWITTNCGKSLKKWEYQTTLSTSWKICMQVKKQQLEPQWKKQTGSKLGKEYVKAVTLLIKLLYRVPHTNFWAVWSTSWNQYQGGEISITSDMQIKSPLWQKA